MGVWVGLGWAWTGRVGEGCDRGRSAWARSAHPTVYRPLTFLSIYLGIRVGAFHFQRCCQQAQSRYHAVDIETVRRCRARFGFQVGYRVLLGKCQWHVLRARRIQVLVDAAFSVNAVETTHHVAVDHDHNGLGHRVLNAFKGRYAFLDDEVGHFHAILDHRHLVALLAGQVAHFTGVFHRHDPHAIGAGVRLDYHKG